MNTIILHTSFGKLSYLKVGIGTKIMICFHGFGQNKNIFSNDCHFKLQKFTFYFIDLYYHGQSMWLSEDNILSKEVFMDIMNIFLEEEKVNSFSLLGYSLGAKSVLTIIQMLPRKVEKCILISPDGIKTSFWYSAATYHGVLNRVFKYVCEKPYYYFKALNFLVQIRLLDKGLMRFAINEMDTKQKRKLVYQTWMVYRELKFTKKELHDIFENEAIAFYVFLGEFDKVIKKNNILKILRKYKHIKTVTLASSHSKLPKFVFESEYFNQIIKNSYE